MTVALSPSLLHVSGDVPLRSLMKRSRSRARSRRALSSSRHSAFDCPGRGIHVSLDRDLRRERAAPGATTTFRHFPWQFLQRFPTFFPFSPGFLSFFPKLPGSLPGILPDSLPDSCRTLSRFFAPPEHRTVRAQHAVRMAFSPPFRAAFDSMFDRGLCAARGRLS